MSQTPSYAVAIFPIAPDDKEIDSFLATRNFKLESQRIGNIYIGTTNDEKIFRSACSIDQKPYPPAKILKINSIAIAKGSIIVFSRFPSVFDNCFENTTFNVSKMQKKPFLKNMYQWNTFLVFIRSYCDMKAIDLKIIDLSGMGIDILLPEKLNKALLSRFFPGLEAIQLPKGGTLSFNSAKDNTVSIKKDGFTNTFREETFIVSTPITKTINNQTISTPGVAREQSNFVTNVFEAPIQPVKNEIPESPKPVSSSEFPSVEITQKSTPVIPPTPPSVVVQNGVKTSQSFENTPLKPPTMMNPQNNYPSEPKPSPILSTEPNFIPTLPIEERENPENPIDIVNAVDCYMQYIEKFITNFIAFWPFNIYNTRSFYYPNAVCSMIVKDSNSPCIDFSRNLIQNERENLILTSDDSIADNLGRVFTPSHPTNPSLFQGMDTPLIAHVIGDIYSATVSNHNVVRVFTVQIFNEGAKILSDHIYLK